MEPAVPQLSTAMPGVAAWGPSGSSAPAVSASFGNRTGAAGFVLTQAAPPPLLQ